MNDLFDIYLTIMTVGLWILCIIIFVLTLLGNN